MRVLHGSVKQLCVCIPYVYVSEEAREAREPNISTGVYAKLRDDVPDIFFLSLTSYLCTVEVSNLDLSRAKGSSLPIIRVRFTYQHHILGLVLHTCALEGHGM